MSKIKIKSLNKKNPVKQVFYGLSATALVILTAIVIRPMVSAQAQDDKQTEATEESTIQNIKKVIQDKQVELGQNNQQSNQSKQAYLAQVKRVSAETLTVLNNQTNVVVSLTDDLEIIKEEEEITVEDIAVDDWVIIYSIMENDAPIIKKILVSDKNFTQENRQIMLGTITEVYSSNLLFDSRTGETNLNYLINNGTQYFDINGDEISLNDLYSDLQCLIVGKSNNGDQWRASSIKALVELAD